MIIDDHLTNQPHKSQVWRFIPLLEASGNVQMAIDSWLLEQHQSGKHPPSLRFYTWSPPAISLGYHQYKYPEHWQYLSWQGQQIDLVRRPTGGRAVLHQGDLTYAVVTSKIPGNRIQVYQKICEFLIQGWRSLGIELHYGRARRSYIHNPNCFGTATDADLVMSNGAKLIGSAQLQRQGTVLQHGSIRLQPDAELFTEVFGTQPCTTTEQLPCLETVIEALVVAACRCFDIQLVTQPLCELEWQQVLAKFSF